MIQCVHATLWREACDAIARFQRGWQSRRWKGLDPRSALKDSTFGGVLSFSSPKFHHENPCYSGSPDSGFPLGAADNYVRIADLCAAKSAPAPRPQDLNLEICINSVPDSAPCQRRFFATAPMIVPDISTSSVKGSEATTRIITSQNPSVEVRGLSVATSTATLHRR